MPWQPGNVSLRAVLRLSGIDLGPVALSGTQKPKPMQPSPRRGHSCRPESSAATRRRACPRPAAASSPRARLAPRTHLGDALGARRELVGAYADLGGDVGERLQRSALRDLQVAREAHRGGAPGALRGVAARPERPNCRRARAPCALVPRRAARGRRRARGARLGSQRAEPERRPISPARILAHVLGFRAGGIGQTTATGMAIPPDRQSGATALEMRRHSKRKCALESSSVDRVGGLRPARARRLGGWEPQARTWRRQFDVTDRRPRDQARGKP